MKKIFGVWDSLISTIQPAGDWLAILPLRLLLAWEFGSAGFMKLNGSNWFGRVQENFPFPFDVIPVEISWFMATWTEVLGGICLFFGLFTRFWAFSLIIVTIVAIFGVHWPDDWSSLSELWKGYAITNKGFGNYRIPLLFIAMLIPLVFAGGGKLSLDNMLYGRLGDRFK